MIEKRLAIYTITPSVWLRYRDKMPQNAAFRLFDNVVINPHYDAPYYAPMSRESFEAFIAKNFTRYG